MYNNDNHQDYSTALDFYPSLPQPKESEWIYSMRRTMQEIVPGLYLGPYSSACKSKLQELLNNGITHIVCVRGTDESHIIRPNFPDNFVYLELNISDSPSDNIIPYFSVVKKFVDNALENKGSVLIHGMAGILRSATLVVAYVMEAYNLGYQEAINLVQSKRYCINITKKFILQLSEYEPIYRARNNMIYNNANSFKKRSLQEMDYERESKQQTYNIDNNLIF